MASAGQKQGLCEHLMVGFDFPAYCARCRDKCKGDDPCVKNKKEARGLQRDQFVKHSKSQVKWYGLHPNQDRPASSVSFWHYDSTKLTSAYSQIARSSGLTSSKLTYLFTRHTQMLGKGSQGVLLRL